MSGRARRSTPGAMCTTSRVCERPAAVSNSRERASLAAASTSVSGMVATAGPLKAAPAGSDGATVPAGWACERVGAQLAPDGVWVQLSGIVGTNTVTGWLPKSRFTLQPGLSADVRQSGAATWQRCSAGLWGTQGAPHPSHVAQGNLSDCYLATAMVAVARDAPATLMRNVVEQGNSVSVTLFPMVDGQPTARTVTLDRFLPASKEGHLVYAGQSSTKTKDQVALWPSIVEKAVATLGGGYASLDQGGSAVTAMQLLTGSRVHNGSFVLNGSADQILTTFENYQKTGVTLYLATTKQATMPTRTSFSGGLAAPPQRPSWAEPERGDPGPYRASFDADGGHIAPGTVKITDKDGRIGTVTDPKPANPKEAPTGSALRGSSLATGHVSYGSGPTPSGVDVAFLPELAPLAASRLRLDYAKKGQLSTSPTIFANHAYLFKGLVGTGPNRRISLINPWGSDHCTVTVDHIKKYFSGMGDIDIGCSGRFIE
jgi:hypothetical protein